MEISNNRHTGKKIWYALVIAICVMIVLLNAVGIIGVWTVQRQIVDTSVNILGIVLDASSSVREGVSRVDDKLAILEAGTTEITEISLQLSQDVTDKGLVMVLLPEEKEQKLAESVNDIGDTLNEVRESISKGLDLYRSINNLPFVSLPSLSDDQMGEIESTTTQIQDAADSLQSSIVDFRSGVASKVDNVVAAANKLTDKVNNGRASLDRLDTKLVALELFTTRLQQLIPCLLITLAVLLSLILAFVIFTQVEVIGLFIKRWRLLNEPIEIADVDAPAPPVEVEESEPKMD